MTRTPEVLVDGIAFGEGPRWRDGKLWFSDMHGHAVMTTDMDGKLENVVEVPTQPSGLGWLPDGRLLIVSMTDRKVLRLENGKLQVHADLSEIATWHCNDMVVDGQGRAYVGNFGWDIYGDRRQPVAAKLALVHPDGRAEVAADELMFPNGIVITPDGTTLTVGETFAGRLTCFDIAENGGLSNRREFARIAPNVPDGICLDAEGAIWSACPVRNECIRVREGGEVVERIPTGRGCFACMLGGPDRKTLFLMTADDSEPSNAQQARSGRIEVVEVDVPGAGWP